MASHGGNGMRQLGRGQMYLAWLVIALVMVFAFQFFAYEQRWASQRSLAIESTQNFEAMLDEFISSPENDSLSNDHRELRQMIDNFCKAGSEDNSSGPHLSMRDCVARFWAARQELQRSSSLPDPPPSRRADQGAAIYDSEPASKVEDGKRVAALEEEVARLREIMRNATTLMNLRDDSRAGEVVEKEQNSFMMTLNPADNSGIPGEFEFPSKNSLGRILCLMGNHTTNGSLNKYSFAWKENLPPNATLVPGITLISNSEWGYFNIWHGMSSLAPFVSWRERNGCLVADRMLLFNNGEVVTWMSSWVHSLVHAIFGRQIPVQTIDQHVWKEKGENSLACFERAVVNRKGLPSGRMIKFFESLRCRTVSYCGARISPPVLEDGGNRSSEMAASSSVHVTLFLRQGARSFKNSSAVQNVIQRVCQEHGNCDLEIAYAGNLTFCEQVWLMSRTDVLITSHGAQLTNAMFMPKGSSVMEFQAYGWLERAGVGQYIYTWLASWAELNHEGIWRDPEGPPCPHPAEDTLACFTFYKDRQLGHNETHIADWTTNVLKRFDGTIPPSKAGTNLSCRCDLEDRERKVAPWLK